MTAGLPPHGVKYWAIKWRGGYIDIFMPKSIQKNDRKTDEGTTDITFESGEDGRLAVSSFMDC
jgi:hypothetical protein